MDVGETQILESTDVIEEETHEETTARRIIPVQEPVITEATASLKKVDDKPRKIVPKLDERARPVVEEQEALVVASEIIPETTTSVFKIDSTTDRARVSSDTFQTVSVSEVHTESSVQEIKRTDSKTRRAKKTVVTSQEGVVEIRQTQVEEFADEKPKKKKRDRRREVSVEDVFEEQKESLLKAVEEIMEMLNVKEFGPGESPLRELATIGFLVSQGVAVSEINESLYRTDQFPALRTPDAQNALVQLVEREGHGALITQVLTEETTTDEAIVAATVGFRAFMRMVELQHTTVEEVITHFAPEDFRPRAWEVTEITEVYLKFV